MNYENLVIRIGRENLIKSAIYEINQVRNS